MLASVAVHAEPGGAATRFDGAWTATITCPSNTEGSAARGYRYDFPVTVVEGHLTGAHGEEGQDGSLRIEGTIPEIGDAVLQAHGRTGDPAFAVQQPHRGTPYKYTIRAHFDETRGTGSRNETRVCDFIFRR